MKKVSNNILSLEKIEEVEINSKLTYQAIVTINKTKYDYCDSDIMKCLNFILAKENEILPDYESDDIPRDGSIIGSLTDQGFDRIILGRMCRDFIIGSSNAQDIDKVLESLSTGISNHLWGKCRARLAADALKMKFWR